MEWLQSGRSTNFEAISSSFPKNNSKATSFWLHILQILGHCSPQSPAQGWIPHSGDISLQGRLHVSWLQGSEHSFVHLECSQPLSHFSLHRLQISPQTRGHLECLHNVLHSFYLQGGQFLVQGYVQLCPHINILLQSDLQLWCSPFMKHWPHLPPHSCPHSNNWMHNR